jgi:hypothetical protein
MLGGNAMRQAARHFCSSPTLPSFEKKFCSDDRTPSENYFIPKNSRKTKLCDTLPEKAEMLETPGLSPNGEIQDASAARGQPAGNQVKRMKRVHSWPNRHVGFWSGHR